MMDGQILGFDWTFAKPLLAILLGLKGPKDKWSNTSCRVPTVVTGIKES
jgi:hypothetical protein